MPISIFLSFYHVLPHIIMPFFNMQRSFRVCVHARVAMHAYESGRKCIHVRNKTFFEGIMLVENEPPCGKSWLRACIGIELASKGTAILYKYRVWNRDQSGGTFKGYSNQTVLSRGYGSNGFEY